MLSHCTLTMSCVLPPPQLTTILFCYFTNPKKCYQRFIFISNFANSHTNHNTVGIPSSTPIDHVTLLLHHILPHILTFLIRHFLDKMAIWWSATNSNHRLKFSVKLFINWKSSNVNNNNINISRRHRIAQHYNNNKSL